MGGESWAWVSDEYRVLKGACGVNIKITQAAIEAGAARYRKIKYPKDGYTDFGVVKEIFEAMLPHLQPTFPPAPATDIAIEDADVERVAKVMWDSQDRFHTWVSIDESIRKSYRNEARAAIRDIRGGGERWAVYCKEDGGLICSWNGFPLGPTTDKAYLLKVFEETKIGDRYWVRPYIPVRAKTSEDIANSILTAFDHYDKASDWKSLRDRIAAAIRDASKGGK
jgi:hypothetical protein